MLDPVNLQVFPSCYNCLSWSADGELAVAAGEYVHILTPARASERVRDDPRTAGGQWHDSRFRANVFTSTEWPVIYPQDRQAFSIGAEQSLSTVVGLAWSPPGIARHRRCVLGVLTSNLILSFYETAGPQGKWTRVGVVNGTLRSYFEPFVHEEGRRLQKTMIRSFTWCPPLKVPVAEDKPTPYSVPDSASRWGIQLVAVTNDDNDVVFLRVQEPKAKTNPFSFELLTLTSLHDLADNYSMIHPGSLFSKTFRPRIKALSVSCGPWIPPPETQTDTYSATSNLAVAYGTTLKIIKLDIKLKYQDQDSGSGVRYHLTAGSEENSNISKYLGSQSIFTGPFQWISTDNLQGVLLAAGAFTELVTIAIPNIAYLGNSIGNREVSKREWPFHDNNIPSGVQTEETRHWEPISAMSVNGNERRDCALYLSTNGGYGAAKLFNDSTDGSSLSPPPWKDSFDSYCEQFDIDRDLGGMVTGRIWGLACHDEVLAVAFTMHPKDMVEYRTAAEERTVIIFTQLDRQRDGEGDIDLRQGTTDISPEVLRMRRETVIGHILHSDQAADGSSLLAKKVIYAAACCAILDCENEELVAQARASLEWLATATGADLSDEISKCKSVSNPIEPKPASDLNGPGKQLFERCDICDAGIGWYSVKEAQCANGHLFVRCNLTFLTIQEPGISKFCSVCGTEYLGEGFVDASRESDLCITYQMLCDAFDLCIYCGGKFQP